MKKNRLTIKHLPGAVKKISNSTDIVTKVVKNPHLVKPVQKKKQTRLVQKHRALKHLNSTHAVPTVQTNSSTPKGHQVPLLLNHTLAAHPVHLINGTRPRKYKLIKVIKRKKKINTLPGQQVRPLPTKHRIVAPHKIKGKHKSAPIPAKTAPITTIGPPTGPASNGTSANNGTSSMPPLNQAIELAVSRDHKLPQSLSVSRNVIFNQPKSGIVHRGDSSGIVSSSREPADVTAPPISKEVIEWMSRERISKGEANLNLHKEIESHRFDMMMQRQENAARQMRLANRLGGSMLRETLNNDLTERLFDSELRRQDDIRRQFKDRDKLRNRMDQLQYLFHSWRR